MKNLGCLRFQEALDGRAAPLSNASRLALEEHLASCDECRKDAAAIDRLRSLAADLPSEISATRRSRAIRAALATEVSARPEPAAKRFPWAVAGGLAVAAAAVLAIGAFALASSSSEIAGVKEGAPKVEPPAPIVEEAAPSHVLASAGDRHVFGAATVELPNGGEFGYAEDERRLTLVRGFLRVVVDPSQHSSFQVDTPRFSVLVLGTIFEVDELQVRVVRGAVKVLAPDGRVLVDRLEAGQTWRADLEPVAELDPTQTEVDTSPDHARRLLSRAREQIAARDLGGAQTTIQAALEAPHGTREAAEAATLRAEIAKNRGDLEAAFRAYRDVARRYSRLPAGESALFAAARIAVQRGDRSSARALFDDYLQRYPSGRYRAEVLRNREALGP